MKFKELIKNFVDITKNNITVYVEYDLCGNEKKQLLDKNMSEYVARVIKYGNLNPIVKWVLKAFIIENIPVITQVIFDLIKSKVRGITE